MSNLSSTRIPHGSCCERERQIYAPIVQQPMICVMILFSICCVGYKPQSLAHCALVNRAPCQVYFVESVVAMLCEWHSDRLDGMSSEAGVEFLSCSPVLVVVEHSSPVVVEQGVVCLKRTRAHWKEVENVRCLVMCWHTRSSATFGRCCLDHSSLIRVIRYSKTCLANKLIRG